MSKDNARRSILSCSDGNEFRLIFAASRRLCFGPTSTHTREIIPSHSVGGKPKRVMYDCRTRKFAVSLIRSELLASVDSAGWRLRSDLEGVR